MFVLKEKDTQFYFKGILLGCIDHTSRLAEAKKFDTSAEARATMYKLADSKYKIIKLPKP